MHADVQHGAWKVAGAATLGRSFGSAGGRWAAGDISVARAFGRINAFLLDYTAAFTYRVGGIQLQPELTLRGTTIRIIPTLTLARWSSDSTAASYAVWGGAAQWTEDMGPVMTQLRGDAVIAGDNGYASGAYGSISADVFRAVGRTSIGVGVQQGATPIESETGFRVWAARTLREGLELNAQVSRALTDPVYGSPGSLGFSVNASWRALHKKYVPRPTIAAVGAPAPRGRLVRFSVKAPRATRVEVSGSFSDWQPIQLRQTGDTWSAEISIEPGTHQYGFLINGQDWYLPPDAVDVIDDGFGRKNATLVVQPL